MNDIHTLYDLWLQKTADDPQLHGELLAIAGNEAEILDRFYRDLSFGTAGLRGVLGAGTNRMNVYTVGQATQGLANYLNAAFDAPSAAIAYDSRINSELFAKCAASVLAANGIKVYLYPTLVPTPMLSFAVRELHCSSGIVITASHNPAQYNGYKCYDPNGYQMTDAAADETYGYIQKVDIFNDVRTVDFDKALASGGIRMIGDDLFERFYARVLTQQIHPGVCTDAGLRVIYTPLNGTGRVPVQEIMKRIGFSDVRVVPEQEMPDGNFPTCPYPNPEIREAFTLALAMAEKDPADLLLATDPDADRVGIAVRDGDDYRLLTGNEVGVLLANYLLSGRKAAGTLPEKPLVIKSFVTTDLVKAVAADYGAEVVDLLTGFKYIGELITQLEQKGEADRFIVGMEESYGYLSGIHARDKDAVVGAMMICEMAAYYKKEGKSLADVMREIYARYGVYQNTVISLGFAGASGMEQMANIMARLRADAPKAIAGANVTQIADYQTRVTVDLATGAQTPITLPQSNVLSYQLDNRCKVMVRPSGTEPKIKIYLTAVADNADRAQALTDRLETEVKALVQA